MVWSLIKTVEEQIKCACDTPFFNFTLCSIGSKHEPNTFINCDEHTQTERARERETDMHTRKYNVAMSHFMITCGDVQVPTMYALQRNAKHFMADDLCGLMRFLYTYTQA